MGLYRIYLDDKNAVQVNKIARKILRRFHSIPCYEYNDGNMSQCQLLEYECLDDDDKIEFIMFYQECLNTGYDIDFIELEIIG